jgi:hypothetical protein
VLSSALFLARKGPAMFEALFPSPRRQRGVNFVWYTSKFRFEFSDPRSRTSIL